MIERLTARVAVALLYWICLNQEVVDVTSAPFPVSSRNNLITHDNDMLRQIGELTSDELNHGKLLQCSLMKVINSWNPIRLSGAICRFNSRKK